MRLVFAGTPEAAIPALRALVESRHEVAAVVTRPDSPAGRGRALRSSAVAAVARNHGIRVLQPRSARDPGFLPELSSIAPDCCAVVAYGALLPADLLAIPRHGWVNLHFSLLPAWRGAAPVQRALMAGDDVTGATTFRIVEELDAGPTYGVVTETIRPDDTAGTLLGRLAESGAGLLIATLDGIEGGFLEPREQSQDGVSHAPKITVEDARVSWNRSAYLIDRQIRACTPDPGAWSVLDGRRLKIRPIRLTDDNGLSPGEIRTSRTDVRVGTATTAVELITVQPEGKAPMPAAAWARGLRGGSGWLE